MGGGGCVSFISYSTQLFTGRPNYVLRLTHSGSYFEFYMVFSIRNALGCERVKLVRSLFQFFIPGFLGSYHLMRMGPSTSYTCDFCDSKNKHLLTALELGFDFMKDLI